MVDRLRCEYLVDPLGIDETTPRLSWQLKTDRRGARQIAYRIQVSSTPEKLLRGEFDRWDSGRIESAQTTHQAYAGKPLRSRDFCFWQVCVWFENGESALSPAARWSMGLLAPTDWIARWIAASPDVLQGDPEVFVPTLTQPGTPVVFSRGFEIEGKRVARATLYVTARGIIHVTLNRQNVTEDLFAPEWTDYDKRIQYRAYDVTALLTEDTENSLSATLGDGWWSGYVGWQETRGRYGSLENSILLQLEIEFSDGTRRVISTDNAWSCATGPILSSDFMIGEVYDARRGMADFSHGRSFSAVEVLPPTARLVAQRSEPVRIVEELPARTVREATPGHFVFDFGQNISGFVRLRLRGLPAGTRLVIRHAELLNPDGTIYTENLRRAKATDVYIAKGAEEETFQPHFTFHGFQYAELSGFPGSPSLDTLAALGIQSATPAAGHFECSDESVNRLWLNGVWSQRDNFLSVPTDCPQRDERLGWTGDAQVFLRTATYNADVAAFFTKWMVDVEDAQTVDGVFPDTAPRLREGENFVGLGGLGGSAGWADVGVIVPYTLWKVYGDRRIIERHYDAMVRWLDWIERHNRQGLRLNQLGNNYGDWLCIPSDTSFGTHSPMKNLLATAYWADDAAKLSRIARELGREEDARRFAEMFETVRAAFQREWVLPDGRLTVETQTAYLLALAFDLLPKNLRACAAARLVENIRDLDWHLSTGFVGISYLNPQLTLSGYADVAYRLLLRHDYPSWLYPVKHGATTIWERWNGWTAEDGFFNPQMNSFNHYSLGSVGEWLFRHVAGIELDPDKPGFQNFILRPFVGAGLSFARATYCTLHGEIRSDWQREGENLTWRIRVPANCTARVFIPSRGGTDVQTDGLTVTERTDEFACVLAEAGSFTFRSFFNPKSENGVPGSGPVVVQPENKK